MRWLQTLSSTLIASSESSTDMASSMYWSGEWQLASTEPSAQRQTLTVSRRPRGNLERLAAALAELGARLRVGGLTDEEARQLPLQLDATTLAAFGSSTWTTDAGPLDLPVELRDPAGGRHPYADLAARATSVSVADLTISVASLEDIIASKRFAGRPKDLEAVPELQALLDAENG